MHETFQAVMMVFIFLVPGFVWRTVEAQFIYLDKRLEWEKFALGLLTRSSFVYLPFAPWIYRDWNDKWYDSHPWCTAFAAVDFILLLPAMLGFASGFIRQKEWIPWLLTKARLNVFEANRIPTAWDTIFSKRPNGWIIVTLKNGSKVHGYMSGTSVVSSDYEDRDIYISHTLIQNAQGALEFVPNTNGVYIRADEISTIEFIKETNEQAQANQL